MMKRTSLIAALLTLFGWSATAQETLSVGEVLVPTGQKAMMEVMFHFNEGHSYVSYQFKVNLPSGVSLVQDDKGNVPVVLGDGQPDSYFSQDMLVSSAVMKAFSNPSTPIAGDDGVLVCIPIQVDQSVAVGQELQGSLTGVLFADITSTAHNFSDVSFTIKVTDKVILDENYSWVPFATDAASDLTVIRTIKANEWSTVCFPFAMSADKLKAAFGDDYDLEELTGYDAEKDADGKVTKLTLNFKKNLAAAKINTPYIIKTTQDISVFEVNARLNPGNAKKAIVVDDDETGEVVEVASVTGTFRANTLVPKNSLFINGNKFYYSAGKTKMKAFRAYFTLSEVLADVAQAGARVTMNIGGETTTLQAVDADMLDDDTYYDLQGRQVQHPKKKGLYIRKGKKGVK